MFYSTDFINRHLTGTSFSCVHSQRSELSGADLFFGVAVFLLAIMILDHFM